MAPTMNFQIATMILITLCCIINLRLDRKGQMCVLRYLSHLCQPKCLTSLTWPRSLVSTRRSWRRQRQKRKTLCPPKRVSARCAPCVSDHCWSHKGFVVCNHLLLSVAPHHHFLCYRETALSAGGSSEANSCNVITHFIHSKIKKQHPHTRLLNKSLPTVVFLSSFLAIEQERKGDATPWLKHTKKRSWDAATKSTFFWLLQYLNLFHCLQKWVLLSSPGCC